MTSMTPLKDIADRIAVITFDCYGTLMDWNAGIRGELTHVLESCDAGGRVDPAEAVAEYHRLEPVIQSAAYRPYRQVLDAALAQLADHFGLEFRSEQRGALSAALPSWPPFADTNPALLRLKVAHRLGVLSNIDRDLFAQTARHLAVDFDFVVTAEDVRAYKPGHAHFLRALAQVKDDRGCLLHVAQSLYLDGVPCRQLGIPWVWINRLGEENRLAADPIAEFPDLMRFTDALLGA